MSPESLFDSAWNDTKLFRFPISSGIDPSKLLWDRLRNLESVEMVNNPLGIGPLKLLLERSSSSNLVRFPSVLGNLPLKAFMPSHR